MDIILLKANNYFTIFGYVTYRSIEILNSFNSHFSQMVFKGEFILTNFLCCLCSYDCFLFITNNGTDIVYIMFE